MAAAVQLIIVAVADTDDGTLDPRPQLQRWAGAEIDAQAHDAVASISVHPVGSAGPPARRAGGCAGHFPRPDRLDHPLRGEDRAVLIEVLPLAEPADREDPLAVE